MILFHLCLEEFIFAYWFSAASVPSLPSYIPTLFLHLPHLNVSVYLYTKPFPPPTSPECFHIPIYQAFSYTYLT
jgi:hypothetical protein